LNEQDKQTLSDVKWNKNEKTKRYIQLLQKHQKCNNKK